MDEELAQARREQDAAFGEFVEHSGKATKENLKAQAARKRYTLARDTVRALERDIMSFPELI